MTDFNLKEWQRTTALKKVASLRESLATQGAPNSDVIVARGAAIAVDVTEKQVLQWMKDAGI
jgi:uncharacterized protein (DUF4213/DUF364 family)